MDDQYADLPADARKDMTTTATDLVDLRARLADWFSEQIGSPVDVGELSRPSEGGMSSVSILLDASWDEDGVRVERQFVVRMPPDSGAFPVFPSYDLRTQYDVISAVAAHSDVPVPPLYWLEESPEPLGKPFIVMGRVDGRVPVDNPPYIFFGWFFDATPEQRRALQDASLDVLARLHAIQAVPDVFPELSARAGADALRSHVEETRAYYEWTRRDDGMRIPVIEDAFDWLEKNWPSEPSETVLSWGDSRIGNVIFDEFAPAAVLDWEMTALAPREMDLAWYLFIHRFFQDLAEQFGQPGLPDVAHRADVIGAYEQASGHTVRDFDWYVMYAALRYAIVMSQVTRRMIHFGEAPVPATPDEYVMFHATVRALLDGSYDWSTK